MTDFLARRAGDALTWKAIQLAGTKGTFFGRTLILASILSPDDFGLFAIPIIALGFLTTTTELGMMPALVHLPEANEAHYNGAWTAGVVRALGISAVLMVAAPVIAAIFAEPRAVAILRVLALKPLIDAIASIRIAELSRDLKYRRLTIVSLSAVAVDTVVSLTLAMALGVWALVVGALVWQCDGRSVLLYCGSASASARARASRHSSFDPLWTMGLPDRHGLRRGEFSNAGGDLLASLERSSLGFISWPPRWLCCRTNSPVRLSVRSRFRYTPGFRATGSG